MNSPKNNQAMPEVSELDLEDLQPAEDASRSLIARRIGLGLLLIAILLGGLHVAEWMESEEEEDVATTDSRDVPPRVIGQTINTGPVLPVTPADAPPTDPAAQHVPTPAAPFPLPLPTPPEPPPAPSVDATPTAKLEPRSVSKPVSRPMPHARAVERNVSPPGEPATTAVAPRTPVTRSAAPPRTEPAAAPPAAPRLFNNYLVQAGVFSNPQKAQELHALLTLNGIPASLETRVKVGPFKNKAEADAAREKLKELGVDSLLIPPSQ